MSRIMRWKCRLPGDHHGKRWPMVCVDEQSEAEYALYGDLAHCKTYIYHDGSITGRTQAEAIARSLAESGEAVRDLGLPGIVAIFNYYEGHTIYERHSLKVFDGRKSSMVAAHV